jgi:hypothetical protein
VSEEQSLTLGETVLLLAWLCLPVLLIVVAALSWLFRRRGLLHSGRHLRPILGILVAIAAIMVLSVPLWLVLPNSLLPSSIAESWVPEFFLPSILAALVVMPLIYLWVVQGARSRAPQ